MLGVWRGGWGEVVLAREERQVACMLGLALGENLVEQKKVSVKKEREEEFSEEIVETESERGNNVSLEEDIEHPEQDSNVQDNLSPSDDDISENTDPFEPQLNENICHLCNLVFSSSDSLASHTNEMHDYEDSNLDESVYENEETALNELPSEEKNEFQITSTVHSAEILENLNVCHNCNTKYKTKATLQRHMKKTHSDDIPDDFCCSLCNEKFVSKSGLAIHTARQHEDNSLQCKICDITFKRRQTLKRHMHNNHSEKSPDDILSFDQKETDHSVVETNKYDENDGNIMSTDNTETVLCPECNFTTPISEGKDELYLHIAEIHMEDELLSEVFRVFSGGGNKCAECHEEVEAEYEMKEHIIIKHQWPMLTAVVEQAYAGVEEKKSDDDEVRDGISKPDIDDEIPDIEVDNIISKTIGEENTKIKAKAVIGKLVELKTELKWYDGSIYECKHCNMKVTSGSAMKSHLINVHKKLHSEKVLTDFVIFKNKEYMCKKCQATLKHEYTNIHSHITYVHNMTIQQYSLVYENEDMEDDPNLGTTENSENESIVDFEHNKNRQPESDQDAQYLCSQCEHIWTNKSGKRNPKKLIKLHLCQVHNSENVTKAVNDNFTKNICNFTNCGAVMSNEGRRKKHLICTHKLFDDKIAKDLKLIMDNPNYKHKVSDIIGTKRKATQSDSSESFQPSKTAKNNVGENNDTDSVIDDADIREIQQCIDFSDSEDED